MIHIEAATKVDFVVRKDEPFRKEEFARRRQVEIAGQTMWIVSPEDLILSKLLWAKMSESVLQRRDVLELVRVVRNLDWPYIERWAAALSVAAMVDELKH